MQGLTSPWPVRACLARSRVVIPRQLVGAGYSMRLVGEPSHILSEAHVGALASAVPPLERMRDWALAYSTK